MRAFVGRWGGQPGVGQVGMTPMGALQMFPGTNLHDTNCQGSASSGARWAMGPRRARWLVLGRCGRPKKELLSTWRTPTVRVQILCAVPRGRPKKELLSTWRTPTVRVQILCAVPLGTVLPIRSAASNPAEKHCATRGPHGRSGRLASIRRRQLGSYGRHCGWRGDPVLECHSSRKGW